MTEGLSLSDWIPVWVLNYLSGGQKSLLVTNFLLGPVALPVFGAGTSKRRFPKGEAFVQLAARRVLLFAGG